MSTYDEGMTVRREVLGDEHVDRATANATESKAAAADKRACDACETLNDADAKFSNLAPGATVSVSVSHGHPFDGVVLVDPERGYGCANIDFGSCPAPDASGQWSGALSMRTWVTATPGLIMSGAVVTAAAALLAGFQIIG